MSILTPNALPPEFFALLEALGVPKHVISLDIRIAHDEPVLISCTFHPTTPDGSYLIDGDALAVAAQKFRLVSVDDAEETVEQLVDDVRQRSAEARDRIEEARQSIRQGAHGVRRRFKL